MLGGVPRDLGPPSLRDRPTAPSAWRPGAPGTGLVHGPNWAPARLLPSSLPATRSSPPTSRCAQLRGPCAELARSRLAGTLTPAYPQPHPPGGGTCSDAQPAPPAQPGQPQRGPPMPPQKDDCSVPAPHLPPRSPLGDSCQEPSRGGDAAPRPLLAPQACGRPKHPPPEPQHPHVGRRTRARGGLGRWPGRAGYVGGSEDRQSLRPTYPARSSLGTAAGAHGADRAWEQAVQRVTSPRRRPRAPQQHCLCPWGVGRGGYKYLRRAGRARHSSRLRT